MGRKARVVGFALSVLSIFSLVLPAAPSQAVTKRWALNNLVNRITNHTVPAWNIFVDGGSRGIAWVLHGGNPRFAVFDSAGDTAVGEEATWEDDLVLDRETGLIWERSPSTATTMTWAAANFHCYNRRMANRNGFRLPSVEELSTLHNPQGGNPDLPGGHPFWSFGSRAFWSSTTSDYPSPGDAWYVSFNAGVGGNHAGVLDRTVEIYAWCVRGGAGHDGM